MGSRSQFVVLCESIFNYQREHLALAVLFARTNRHVQEDVDQRGRLLVNMTTHDAVIAQLCKAAFMVWDELSAADAKDVRQDYQMLKKVCAQRGERCN